MVLSGGGAKGSFEVGALALLGTRGVWDDLGVVRICGTSVGAINAVALAEDGGTSTIRKVIDIWLSLERPEDMFRPEPWLEEVQREVGDAAETGVLLGGVGALGGPLLGLGALTLKIIDLVGDVKEAGEGRSLFNLEPVRAKLDSAVDWDRVRGSAIDLHLVAVNQVTGNTTVMTKELTLLRPRALRQNPPMYDYGNFERVTITAVDDAARWREQLIGVVMASAAIPGVFPAVHITVSEPDGNDTVGVYVDGGVTEVLPVMAAESAAGDMEDVDAVLAISAGPVDAEQSTKWSDPRFPARANWIDHMERALSSVLAEVHRRDLDQRPEHTDLVHVAPALLVHDTMDIHPGLIRINMAYGYMRCFDELAAHGGLGQGAVSDLRESSHRIARLRRDALMLQQRVKIETGQTGRVSFTTGVMRRLRNRKSEIGRLVNERVLRFGSHSMPLDLDPHRAVRSWWTDWELDHANRFLPPYMNRQLVRPVSGDVIIIEPEDDELFERRLVDLHPAVDAVVG